MQKRNMSSTAHNRTFISKTRTVSPVSRAKSRIHIFNRQLPKFAQVTLNDIKLIHSKQELELILTVPLVSHKLKKLGNLN